MKILIVVANFVPEIGSAAHIYYDLASAFVKRGHEVDVITSYPRSFYLDKNDKIKEFLFNEEINGIKVHRYKNNTISRDNVVLRGFEHFWLPIAYYNLYKKLNKKFDVCLMYIPPLPLYYLARWIKGRDKTPSVLNYQDFHPQELIDVGMMKNLLLIRLMEHIEKQSYKNADYITVMSNAGIDFIVKRGGNHNKITCIYNSVNPLDFDTISKIKTFKEKENISDKILVSYAGILSPFQGLDDILNAAKLLKDKKDIVFYIVGDGMAKNHLIERVKIEHLDNVKILPLQPRDEYFNIINSSDISIVSLDKHMSAPCLPGKFINLLGVRQSIIANIPKSNDVAYIVQTTKCGIAVEPDNPDQFAAAILRLRDDAELRYINGINGRKFLEEKMNLEKNVKEYEQIFNSLI